MAGIVQRFRKKPVEIEAMQWPADVDDSYESVCQRAAIHRWVNDNGGKTDVGPHANLPTSGAHIITLEGAMKIGGGDYVIRGVQGEFYPCKPDIFDATYEAV
jgi:hypothetical protein